MKVVIVEDEIVAASTLQRMVRGIRPDFEVLTVLQTVEDSVEWFSTHQSPDLVFMDIHLADGSSFSIFEKVAVDCPIVFTTAYNEYALEAFEVNGIDYLLKPINKLRLEHALAKFDHFSYKGESPDLIANLIATLNEKQNRYKTHFLIPHRDKLVPLAVDDFAYIISEFKVARVVVFDNKSYSLDYSLEELMKHLDPERFFRVNRQYVVSHRAIDDLSVWFGGKLSVNLNVPVEERIIVSKAKVPEFKAWFTREF